MFQSIRNKKNTVPTNLCTNIVESLMLLDETIILFDREEVDLRKAKKVSYKQMEVTNIQSVVTLRNKIYAQQGQVDIIIFK